MSEFQYYEFVAIDRPLGLNERKRLRTITTRATITSTRLVNTQWGDFKGDPHELVAKYFDAFLYYANWGARAEAVFLLYSGDPLTLQRAGASRGILRGTR